jgi:hypothetical protein
LLRQLKSRIQVNQVGRSGTQVFDVNMAPISKGQLVDVNYLDRSATTILAGGSGE